MEKWLKLYCEEMDKSLKYYLKVTQKMAEMIGKSNG